MNRKLKRSLHNAKYIVFRETLVDTRDHVWSFLGAFIAIALLTLLQLYSRGGEYGIFLIASFGASCVLIFGTVESPYAQPRNLIGGHVIAALIGVSMAKLLPDMLYLSAPLTVALSIVAQQMTKTLHPPGGATGLLAVIGGEPIHALGYYYVLCPVLAGCLILLSIARICNNISHARSYPAQGQAAKRIKRLISRSLKKE